MTDFELFNESGLSLPIAEADYVHILQTLSLGENVLFTLIEAVYVDENKIQDINQKYLGKTYVTDVITFTYSDDLADNQSEVPKECEGTIYMCAQRIQEQATELNTAPTEEFQRVFIHGLLHLCGYSDHDEASKTQMTLKENFYLAAL